MDKVIDKVIFDVVIQLARDYWNGPYGENIKERLEIVRRFLTEHFPEYNRLYDFLQATISTLGRDSFATNEDVYKVLECLGWRVKDEEQVS